MRGKVDYVSLLLRLGLAFVFAYAAYSSLRAPADWIGYVPHEITKFISATTFMKIMSAYELVLGAWLVSGYCVQYAAAVSTLTLAGITFGNLSAFEITFRDVGLLCMGAALTLYKSPTATGYKPAAKN